MGHPAAPKSSAGARAQPRAAGEIQGLGAKIHRRVVERAPLGWVVVRIAPGPASM